MAALAEVPGQGVVYCPGRGRDRREQLHQGARPHPRHENEGLGERVGVSASYISQSRGRRNMGVRVQALVEPALEAQATVASAQLACVDPRVLWDRTDA